MNGYDLMAHMRRTRRKNPLTATEQALYTELVAICNEVEWADVFTCSNFELCNSLFISENTLKDARNRLIQAGLIFYKSGKSKRQFSKYSFIVDLSTTSKFDTNTATNSATVTTPNTATNGADYYKHKTETKPLNVFNGQEKNFANGNFADLTKIELNNSIEYLDRVAQKKFSHDELLSYFEGFKLQYSTEFYHNRTKVIQHFRDWLKKQKNGSPTNPNGNKPHNNGTSEKRIAALKEWGRGA